MNRRELLQKLAITTPGIFLMPGMLSSCFRIEEELFRTPNSNINVAIVGAGAAGLYAGLILERLGINYTIYEASDRIGGRIRSVSGLAPYPIELGANRLWGSNTIAADLSRASKRPFLSAKDVVQSFDYKGGVSRRPDIVSDPEFSQIRTFVEDILDYQGPPISVLSLFVERGIPDTFRDLTEALFSVHFGGSLSQLDAREIGDQMRLRIANGEILELDGVSFISIFEQEAAEVIAKVRFNQQMRLINYTGAKVVMTPVSGAEVEADYVILTAPVNVLKSNLMVFRPLLPNDTSGAIQSMQQRSAYTIALRFNRRFWTSDTKEIFTQGLVPYYFIPEKSRESGQFILVGHAQGPKADALAAMGNNASANVVQNLNQIFNTDIPGSSFVDARIENWSANAYIRGGISVPTIDAQRNREVLTRPIDNKLFLAGEAISTNGHSGTIHGAMESAFNAVNRILEVADLS